MQNARLVHDAAARAVAMSFARDNRHGSRQSKRQQALSCPDILHHAILPAQAHLSIGSLNKSNPSLPSLDELTPDNPPVEPNNNGNGVNNNDVQARGATPLSGLGGGDEVSEHSSREYNEPIHDTAATDTPSAPAAEDDNSPLQEAVEAEEERLYDHGYQVRRDPL